MRAGKEAMASYPRAIVLLINKVPSKELMSKIKQLDGNGKELLSQNSKFEHTDIEKAEQLCSLMCRCHDLIN
jgi:hypothetical protein